jgi:hypothetical protein
MTLATFLFPKRNLNGQFTWHVVTVDHDRHFLNFIIGQKMGRDPTLFHTTVQFWWQAFDLKCGNQQWPCVVVVSTIASITFHMCIWSLRWKESSFFLERWKEFHSHINQMKWINFLHSNFYGIATKKKKKLSMRIEPHSLNLLLWAKS